MEPQVWEGSAPFCEILNMPQGLQEELHTINSGLQRAWGLLQEYRRSGFPGWVSFIFRVGEVMCSCLPLMSSLLSSSGAEFSIFNPRNYQTACSSHYPSQPFPMSVFLSDSDHLCSLGLSLMSTCSMHTIRPESYNPTGRKITLP